MRLAYKLAAACTLVAMPLPAVAAPIEAVMYKNPTCSCCETYAAYLEKTGLFKIDLKPTNDLTQVAARLGVPEKLQGCHSLVIGKYVIEGFVPVDHVKKMLVELPEITGLSMPGMPMGIPDMGFDSMPGVEKQTYTTYAFTADGKEPTVYATYPEN